MTTSAIASICTTPPLAASPRTECLFFSNSFSSIPLKCRRSNKGAKLSLFLNLSSSMSATLCKSAASTLGSEISDSPSGVGETDLLVVGPGVLGRLIAQQWREEHPGSQIYGQTLTTEHHEELISLGIRPATKDTRVFPQYPYVVFCAPPYKNADYAGEVRNAVLSWNGEGAFLFTSSSAPYDVNDNGPCDENSPVVPLGRNPRTDVLLSAEKEVVGKGGCVVRLAGLYTINRGAHKFWLEKGTSDIRPDHILNLIHYEDAASLCIAVLRKKIRDRIYVGCDNHPVSRQEVMDIVAKSGKFTGSFKGFTGSSDPLGKRLNNTRTREELGWQPKYQSFAEFLGVSTDTC